MHAKRLDSGLVVVELGLPPEPAPPPSEPRLKCCVCGAESTAPLDFFVYKTKDGFRTHAPSCGHGRLATCPTCEYPGCAVCGNQCEHC